MKIGIDISQIVYSGTGVARYTNGLVEAILRYQGPHQWTFFFSSLRRQLDPKLRSRIAKSGQRLVSYPFAPTLLSLVWNKWHVGRIEWLTGNLDWFISSDWTEPPSKKTKKATIVHDLVYLRYPETVDWKVLKTQQQRLIRVKEESQLIFADSHSTADDLVELLGISRSQIEVVYPGVSLTEPDSTTIKKILDRHQLTPNQFILAVGKLEPRKNLERLIAAHAQLPDPKLPLVIAGPKGWGRLNLTGQSVRTLGLVSDQELAVMYRSCRLFVYPSLYEGFGYPLIEAGLMARPMAVSNCSSLSELGQGIALLFNPENVHDMASKMQKLLTDHKLAKDLGSRAERFAQTFVWERSLEQMISSLEQR